jgi:hypothetical protein
LLGLPMVEDLLTAIQSIPAPCSDSLLQRPATCAAPAVALCFMSERFI